MVLVSCKSENPAAERLNLSFDTVSLDSSGGRRDAAQEDDTDFYSGGNIAVFAAAGSSLQNGVAAAVTSSSYSEALTPVTNKVGFIFLTEWTSFTCFYFRCWKFLRSRSNFSGFRPLSRLELNPVSI